MPIKLLLKNTLLGVCLLGYNAPVKAQISGEAFLDIGSNQALFSTYLKPTVTGTYSFNKLNLNAGLQTTLLAESPLLSDYYIGIDKDLIFKNYEFNLIGRYIFQKATNTINENNFIVALEKQKHHFEYKLGFGFRSYAISRTFYNEQEFETRRLSENWVPIFSLKYNVKPKDYLWNAGIAVTNVDYFLMNQETNPMLYIDGYYSLNKDTKLFAEVWLKQAGMMNISVSYFGTNFRTGVKWQPSILH